MKRSILSVYTNERRDVLGNTFPEAREISQGRGFCTPRPEIARGQSLVEMLPCGTDKRRTREDKAIQPLDDGRLSFAIYLHLRYIKVTMKPVVNRGKIRAVGWPVLPSTPTLVICLLTTLTSGSFGWDQCT